MLRYRLLKWKSISTTTATTAATITTTTSTGYNCYNNFYSCFMPMQHTHTIHLQTLLISNTLKDIKVPSFPQATTFHTLAAHMKLMIFV